MPSVEIGNSPRLYTPPATKQTASHSLASTTDIAQLEGEATMLGTNDPTAETLSKPEAQTDGAGDEDDETYRKGPHTLRKRAKIDYSAADFEDELPEIVFPAPRTVTRKRRADGPPPRLVLDRRRRPKLPKLLKLAQIFRI
ncbi:hypothetical protein EsH8_XV_000029 [Colletotrichum jinshuiense]